MAAAAESGGLRASWGLVWMRVTRTLWLKLSPLREPKASVLMVHNILGSKQLLQLLCTPKTAREG